VLPTLRKQVKFSLFQEVQQSKHYAFTGSDNSNSARLEARWGRHIAVDNSYCLDARQQASNLDFGLYRTPAESIF
jgi:hypothetical protein